VQGGLPSPPVLSPSAPLPFLALPFTYSSPSSPLPFPLEVWPLKPARGLGGTVSSPSGVQGRAPVENEFGAL